VPIWKKIAIQVVVGIIVMLIIKAGESMFKKAKND